MFARLWWKEARQTWPAWAFLACVGVALQGLVRLLAGPGPAEGYIPLAAVVTVIYLFLIAAAVFAGERENGTLGLLDALPVDRLRLWAAKASFALATTLALGALLWLSGMAFGGYIANLGPITYTALVWGMLALGWGLLWSAVLGNAMHSAVLAMASLGATLAGLVNLQEGPSTEAAPLLIVIGLVTAAASAFAFVRTGPPRWEPRRARPAPEAVAREDAFASEVAPAGVRRLPRVWTYSVGRLVWETWREIRADLRILLAVAIVAAAFYRMTEWDRSSSWETLLIAMAILSLTTGVATFNRENRGRTHSFLDQHGARPGVAWAVKVLMWWAATIVLWVLVQIPNLLKIGSGRVSYGFHGGAGVYGLWTIFAAFVGALTIPYAVGVLSGMVFRRGVMAGSIAVVVVIALAMVLGMSTTVGIMDPSWPSYVAVAILAVSWAWSGDWLRFAPGVGKWARLALWCGTASVVLISGYIGGRAWNVPTLPPDESQSLFRPESFGRPSPPDEDAAPLYREAGRAVIEARGPVLADGSRPHWPFDIRTPEAVRRELLADPGVAAWLEKLEPALATLRKASLLPDCDYEDPRKATIFTLPQGPSYTDLVTPLAVSARVRLGRGDLDGSWDEVETLLRIARQYSKVRSWTYFSLEPLAVGLAMEWAADPKQTAASLERALASYRSLPRGFTPADRARLERNAFQNTANLPRGDAVDLYLRWYGLKKVATLDAIGAQLLTTPWEIARARKVYDLLAGSWIQKLGDRPYADLPLDPSPRGIGWRALPLASHRTLMLRSTDESSVVLGPEELNGLEASTPIVRMDAPGRDGGRYPRIEAERRALALILRLRLYQARHDGVLPRTLAGLLPPEGSKEFSYDAELRDPYSTGWFGFMASSGQPLIPLADRFDWGDSPVIDPSVLKPSDGCWLLYSVGPDLNDDRASRNLDSMQVGDLVYPLKDGVKPPAAGAP